MLTSHEVIVGGSELARKMLECLLYEKVQSELTQGTVQNRVMDGHVLRTRIIPTKNRSD